MVKSHTQQVPNYAGMLGAYAGMTVQELGWDEDCDLAISEAVEDVIGQPVEEEDSFEPCDAVLLWWRDEDGDLVDGLVDATRNLADHGKIWLLTPAAGTAGTIEPGIIAESAQLAGLVQTTANRLGQWQCAVLVSRGKA
ncbi:MAG: DUF3052 domain-containing protein [Corynebacterium sp.]|nr:DUF3052 domain-containing protein [Corynebacterium sp.]